jgi:hypothetical protein
VPCRWAHRGPSPATIKQPQWLSALACGRSATDLETTRQSLAARRRQRSGPARRATSAQWTASSPTSREARHVASTCSRRSTHCISGTDCRSAACTRCVPASARRSSQSSASLEAGRLRAGHADLKDTQRHVHAVAADLEAAIRRSLGQGVGNGAGPMFKPPRPSAPGRTARPISSRACCPPAPAPGPSVPSPLADPVRPFSTHARQYQVARGACALIPGSPGTRSVFEPAGAPGPPSLEVAVGPLCKPSSGHRAHR